MLNEQSSSAVYGVFFEATARPFLLGLYFLEGEAEAARQAYIAEQVAEYPQAEQASEERYYQDVVVVRQLQMGQAPSYNFVA